MIEHLLAEIITEVTGEPRVGRFERTLAEAALRRISEVLLSDEVVERAAYAMYVDRPLELDQEGGDDWAILPDEWKFEWSEGARAAIEGALGIHGSEGRES